MPLIVSVALAAATAGLKELIEGAGIAGFTVKDDELVALPLPVTLTAIGPVLAAAGTVVLMSVFEDETTVAAAPLNVTAFCDGVALKPEPRIVTLAPGEPLVGENAAIVTVLAFWREIESRLPTASYA